MLAPVIIACNTIITGKWKGKQHLKKTTLRFIKVDANLVILWKMVSTKRSSIFAKYYVFFFSIRCLVLIKRLSALNSQVIVWFVHCFFKVKGNYLFCHTQLTKGDSLGSKKNSNFSKPAIATLIKYTTTSCVWSHRMRRHKILFYSP